MHSVGVTWREVPEGHRHSDILSYTVTYHSATPGDPMQVKSITTPTRFATLTNLTKNTNYSITVMGSNQGGNGPPSSPTFAITDNGSTFYFLLARTPRSIRSRKKMATHLPIIISVQNFNNVHKNEQKKLDIFLAYKISLAQGQGAVWPSG